MTVPAHKPPNADQAQEFQKLKYQVSRKSKAVAEALELAYFGGSESIWNLTFLHEHSGTCELLQTAENLALIKKEVARLTKREIDLSFGLLDPGYEKETVTGLLAKYDQLNSFWGKAEERLAALYTPVYCSFAFKRIPNGYDGDIVHSLCWYKWGKDWRLCYELFDYACPEDVSHRPIVDCSADVRVDAIPAFEPLRVLLLDKAAQYGDKVQIAIERLADILGIK